MLIHRYIGDPEGKGWALATIKDGLLKVSRLSEFNDPFEGMHFDENATIHVPEKPGLGISLRA